jgi:hypothetical protein
MKAPLASKEGVGAPEIEITPEMIEVGILALTRFDIYEPTTPELEAAVASVFLAMLRAQTKSSNEV